ncbi:cation:proton antiporter [Feifania hominis]|uniref:Cation:proton antiporter n=1 Tax=Feifania hominis TaxID=2763660 RepID=A0A926DCN6_9FIRM|nr:cation:proton antiporter [Feifania hominis]MBC8535432.1 cation:proton antiporter [Feifania hominis]
MLQNIQAFFADTFTFQTNTLVILSIAAILAAGFLLTRFTKPLHLPNVTGYILAGIVIGPYVLHLIPVQIISGMEFVTDMALSFIAFGVGKYLKLSSLRKNGSTVFVLTLCEALVAAVVVTLTMLFVFHLPLSFSLLLGAIGSATAPASTIMTIRQYKAKGNFVNLILQVVALDDAVALIAFSICAAVAQAVSSRGAFDAYVVIIPIVLNMAAVGIGILLGFLLTKLINDHRSKDHCLVVTIALLMLMSGLCSAAGISPLLSCMALGTAYSNLSGNKNLFKQVNKFTPPILTTFFVLSGMRLDINALVSAGVIGITYFAVRIVGKYLGSFLGASITGADRAVRNYFGLTLIPQAGVSIGLAILGARLLPPDMGALLSTIILSSSVLYEMIGPISAKTGLYLAGVINWDGPKKPQSPAISRQEQQPVETANHAGTSV